MNGLLAVGLQIWAIQVGSDGSPNLPSVFLFLFFFSKKIASITSWQKIGMCAKASHEKRQVARIVDNRAFLARETATLLSLF
jgi:hypothetical protein